MEKLIEILEDIQPDADYESCTTLIDDGILDSFAILSIVSELQDEFDITITPADIIPDNFNSAKALWDMVCRLKCLWQGVFAQAGIYGRKFLLDNHTLTC